MPKVVGNATTFSTARAVAGLVESFVSLSPESKLPSAGQFATTCVVKNAFPLPRCYGSYMPSSCSFARSVRRLMPRMRAAWEMFPPV